MKIAPSGAMRQTILTTLLSLIYLPILIGQIHTPVFPSLEGEQLTDSVVLKFKPITVLNYDKARDTMYSKIDNIDGKVNCIYSGHSLELPENVDPSLFLFSVDNSLRISAEHVFPQSKGADEDSGNAYSDLHHIYPARHIVNGARNNFPFQEIPDSETTDWYFQTEKLESLPTSNIDFYSERINGAFEPAEKQKGNIARSMFYFYMMYQEEADHADPDFFESQRTTICDWHLLDPIDEKEWNRTHKIAQYQDGKPNPFVLDCTLAMRSFCPHLATNCQGLSSTSVDQSGFQSAVVFPNPASGQVNIRIHSNASSNVKVNVFSNIGKLIQSTTFKNSTTVENTFSIPINAKGMVVLEIVSGDQIWREKVLLVN